MIAKRKKAVLPESGGTAFYILEIARRPCLDLVPRRQITLQNTKQKALSHERVRAIFEPAVNRPAPDSFDS